MDPRPDSSPERGSFSTLLKSQSLRRGSIDPSSGSGAVSSDDGQARAGFRNSISKLKSNSSTDLQQQREDRRGSNLSNESSNSPRRLSKLVPSSSRSKRLKKKLSPSGRSAEPTGLGISPDTTATLRPLDGLRQSFTKNKSSESLGGANNKSGASSLLTSDSDVEESPTRPPLDSRPSHTGYLTLSSPLVTAETLDPEDSSKQSAAASTSPTTVDTANSNAPTGSEISAGVPSLPAFTSSRERYSLPDALESSSEKQHLFSEAAVSGASSGGEEVPVKKEVPKSAGKPPSLITTATQRSSTQTSTSSGTPSTVITPPSPEFQNTTSSTRRDSISKFFQSSTSSQSPPTTSPSIRVDTSQHRRSKSASTASTKLPSSNFIPLTPALEEVKTPGGTLTQPNTSPGFFSSVFSATQNAVSSISNSFNSTSNFSRGRSATSSTDTEPEKRGPAGGEEVILPNPADDAEVLEDHVEQEPAIATMGSGNLSLSQLGIAETGFDPAALGPASSSEDLSKVAAIHQDGQFRRPSEEASAAAAVSAAYADQPPSVVGGGNLAPSLSSAPLPSGRPRSIESGTGTISPPRSLANEFEGASSGTPARRSDSVRSRISDKRRKGRRNSSMNTGSTIAAAIGASHATVGAPAGKGLTQRPTGFAVASSKRNKDFHQLFKSVPENDYLIEDYSAALQRDILLHGRLYISEKHICFSSNILGWVTNLVISFDEVVSMEKKSTAVIFPNAIVIQTLHTKSVFASFIARDSTYDLLIGIWRIGHPNLKTTENGHTLDNNSTREEKLDAGESIDEEDESDSVYDVDDEEDDDDDEDDEDETGPTGEANGAATGPAGDIGGETPRVLSTTTSKSIATATAIPSVPSANTAAIKTGDPALDATGPTAGAGADFPGPITHPPTECSDQDSHFDKPVQDTTIPAPLGKVYSMMFGPASGAVMRKFLVEDQKSTDLQMEDDKKGMGEDVKSFSYSFVKPLNGSIGPKQTKCIVSQTLDAFDLEKAVSVTCSTQTPDVPSGNVFTTKTKYCLTWGAGNATRLVMNSTVEWTGKSWVKGLIEKGASEGQVQYGTDLAAFLKSQVVSRTATKGPKGKVKGKKRKTNESPTGVVDDSKRKAGDAVSQSKHSSSWGPLEPIHGVFDQIFDLLRPFFNFPAALGLMLLLVITMWLRQSYVLTSKDNLAPGPGQQKFVGYEQMWQQEESELWDWLEHRINLNAMLDPLETGEKTSKRAATAEAKAAPRFEDAKMSDRQVHDAIKVTEERLGVLKEALEKKKEQGRI